MNASCRVVWLIVLLASYALTAVPEEANAGVLTVTLENDLFYGQDRHYTNGVRAVWAPDRTEPTPKWVLKLARLAPWFPREGTTRHGYAIGQSMFTPRDIRATNPPLDERPYAGWLYGGVGVGVESGKQLDLFGISLGVVGPASLGEQTQKFFHKLVGTQKPRGWASQLKDEPGIIVTYQRIWRGYATTTLIGNQLDLSPGWGATLGNVFTYANAGVTVRYGKRLPNDYGPPRIEPGLPGSPFFTPASHFGWYVFTSVEGLAVAHNIFLDGNTFRESRSVDKKRFVGDLQFGLVLDWREVRLAYTHVIRSLEFRTQKEHDEFGALSLSLQY